MTRASSQGRRSVAGPVIQLLAGVFLVIAAAWSTSGVWDAVAHGHPLLPWLAAVFLILGLALIAWVALKLLRPRAASLGGRKGVVRAISIVAIVVASLGTPAAAIVALSKPVPPDSVALSAISDMSSGQGVRYVQRSTWVELTPAKNVVANESSGASETGVLFWPGRPVDARAYAAILEPIAEAGFLVVVPQVPLGAAVLPTSQADQILSAHPEVQRWIAAGHSMGGLAAVSHATGSDGHFAGVMLWGSYPLAHIPEKMPVLLVLGTQDPFAPPTDLDKYKKLLPRDAKVVVVQGSNHGTFGDYGPQAGDHAAIGSREQHRKMIIDESVAFVTEIARR